MSMFIASYGLVVGTNYLVVFVLLVIIYYKILKRIKRMRIIHGKWKEKEKRKKETDLLPLFLGFLYLEQNHSTHNLYGATEALIIRGQSQARKRVIYFLTVFIISGFFSECTTHSAVILQLSFRAIICIPSICFLSLS